MNSTSFFCFGPEDSYISKSFAGLTYHVHSQPLHQLLTSGTVGEVYWASLGPVIESWVLSYKTVSGGNKIVRGVKTPPILRTLLDTTTPSPHFRCTLGPDNSFIAWSPSFIRWSALPPSLETCLQSWLTPSGWKAGPPRLITWGSSSAFFALSEYGESAYRFTEDGVVGKSNWPIFKETVEEWTTEKKFSWGDLAYIALDATTEDQFIAIRNDGTWAGSIEDEASETLESFALNFFRQYKPRTKTKTNGNPNTNTKDNGSSNPQPTTSLNGNPQLPTPQSQAQLKALYDQWNKDITARFAAATAMNHPHSRKPKKLQVRSQSQANTQPPTRTPSTPSQPPIPPSSLPNQPPTIPTPTPLLTSFPHIPSLPPPHPCLLPPCLLYKSQPTSLRACPHDIEFFLRLSGSYSYEWLRKERVVWHPDRFGRLCESGWREEGMKMAEEMFKVLEGLMGGLEEEAKRDGDV